MTQILILVSMSSQQPHEYQEAIVSLECQIPNDSCEISRYTLRHDSTLAINIRFHLVVQIRRLLRYCKSKASADQGYSYSRTEYQEAPIRDRN